MKDSISRWYKKIWITRGARFNAHARFEKHADLSNLTISILTAYIITINLFPQISFLKETFNANDTNYLTLILSILVLVISQYINSKEYRIKGLKFHNCGKELSRLYEELTLIVDNANTITLDQLKAICRDYQNIIDKCEENHTKVDMLQFYHENIKEFKDIKYPILFSIKIKFLMFKEFMVYYMFIILPPLIFIFYIKSK